MQASRILVSLKITYQRRHAWVKVEHVLDSYGTTKATFARAVRLKVQLHLIVTNQSLTSRTDVHDTSGLKKTLPADWYDAHFVVLVYRNHKIRFHL